MQTCSQCQSPLSPHGPTHDLCAPCQKAANDRRRQTMRTLTRACETAYHNNFSKSISFSKPAAARIESLLSGARPFSDPLSTLINVLHHTFQEAYHIWYTPLMSTLLTDPETLTIWIKPDIASLLLRHGLSALSATEDTITPTYHPKHRPITHETYRQQANARDRLIYTTMLRTPRPLTALHSVDSSLLCATLALPEEGFAARIHGAADFLFRTHYLPLGGHTTYQLAAPYLIRPLEEDVALLLKRHGLSSLDAQGTDPYAPETRYCATLSGRPPTYDHRRLIAAYTRVFRPILYVDNQLPEK